MLDFKVEQRDGKCVFSVIGRIDAVSSSSLASKVQEVFTKYDDVVVDCSELNYISSAGIRIIVCWVKAKYKFVMIVMSRIFLRPQALMNL